MKRHIQTLSAICGILTATHAQNYNVCWWYPTVLYTPGQPGYTPGFWAFAYQTPASAIVQSGFSYYYTNRVITRTWYVTTTGQTVTVDPGTIRGGTNAVATLSVSVCGGGIKSIHATVTGILNFSGYNEAHMVLQQVD
jgi:hypothetical protein